MHRPYSRWQRCCHYSPLLIVAVLSSCKSDDGADAVRITEFMASNANGLTDDDGETSDWIELHNSGGAAIDLTGWRLTDDASEPSKWVFPPTSLASGQYLVVFASGKPMTPDQTELHASFRLKATPDFLALLRPNGRAVQRFDPYPEQRNDVSYGVASDGVTGYLESPTPGAPNVGRLDETRAGKGSKSPTVPPASARDDD